MNPDIAIRIEAGLRALVPGALTMLLAVLAAVPLTVPGLGSVLPSLALMSVFYWTIYRPDLLPRLAVFAIGFLVDSLEGTPLGLTSFTLVVVQSVVAGQRRFFLSKTFIVVWPCFALVAAGEALLRWVLASIYFGTAVAPAPVLYQFMLTLAAYPCLTWLFGRAHMLAAARQS